MTEIRADQIVLQEVADSAELQAEFISALSGTINDIPDVTIVSPADNEVLTFNIATGDWENQTATGGAANNWLIANNNVNFPTPPISTGVYSIVLGDGATSGSSNTSIVIGRSAAAHDSATSAIAIGTDATVNVAFGVTSIAIGNGATTNGASQIAIGTFAAVAAVGTVNSIAIGQGSNVLTGASTALALGRGTSVASNNQIAIGRNATCSTSAESSMAIGYGATVDITATNTIVIGRNARSADDNQVIIGTNAVCAFDSSARAVGIGPDVILGANSSESIVIGSGAYTGAITARSIVIGSGANSPTSYTIDTIAIGSSVVSGVSHSVTIGSNRPGNENQIYLHDNGNLELIGTDSQFVMPSYTVATLPVGTTGGMILVTDETGGSVPAFFDGTNWRRVTDRIIVS